MADRTAHAEQRIRTLLAVLDPGTENLGAEIVYDKAFRSEEWPRTAYALGRADLEAVLVKLDQARTLRIMPRSLEPLVDPEIHTPTRINAYLKAHGWRVLHEYPTVTQWRIEDLTRPGWAHHGSVVTVYGGPDWLEYSDYADTVVRLVVDLAGLHGTGELQVLTDIAEAADA